MNQLTTTTTNHIQIHHILNYDNNLSSTTAKVYGYFLARFNAHIGGHWERVTKQVIIDYTNGLKASGMKNSSINNNIKAIKRFYSMLIDKGHIESNPVDGIKYLKESQVDKTNKYKWLDESTLDKLFAELKKDTSEIGLRNYAIFAFMTFTGVRASELCNMKLSNIIYQDDKPVELRFIGKGDKERIIDIDLDVMELIWKYREKAGLTNQEDYLFYTTLNNKWKTRKPMNRHGLYYTIRAQGKKIGIEKLHPHIMRHTNITHLIKNGCPIQLASQHAGHSSIDITVGIYCHDESPVMPYMDKLKKLVA